MYGAVIGNNATSKRDENFLICQYEVKKTIPSASKAKAAKLFNMGKTCPPNSITFKMNLLYLPSNIPVSKAKTCVVPFTQSQS